MSTGPDEVKESTVEAEAEIATEIDVDIDSGIDADVDVAVDAEADADPDTDAEYYPPLPPPPVSGLHRARIWAGGRLPVVITTAVLAVSAVTAGSVYWWLYRPDVRTGTAVQDQVLDAARVATESLLSYSPDTVDQNVADAKSRLTGDFLNRYSEFADTVVVPAARERGVKTEANVARAAVSQMKPDTADVLVFVNQVTTSRERPTPALATSSVMMTLVRDGDRWLVSEFNPI